MIDNPTPAQRMDEMDQQYMAEQFYEHCTDRANEIARDYNLLPEFYEDFAKDLIDDWWEENSDIYDTFKTPYMEKSND